MNCEILRTLYIRSNGDVPCHDDAGESITLGHVPLAEPQWHIGTLFGNATYAHIRESFRAGTLPWPDVCPECAWLRPAEQYQDGLAQRRVAKIHVEPSLACRLRCPCCSNALQVKRRPKPFYMPVDLFERTLQSLRDGAFQVDEIEYCGQGEPLLHPAFPQFVRLAREYFPRAVQRLISSGNVDYQQATGGERLDEIFVSCDGIFPANYAKYRVGGDVGQVIRFMKDAPREIGGKRQALIWKYILFEFNDSDAEIYAAQDLAYQLGVHTILFVFTHSQYRSRRYTLANAESFPIYFPNVITNGATNVQRHRRAVLVAHWLGEGRCAAQEAPCVVDEVTTFGARWLDVQGWALAPVAISAIRIAIDGQEAGSARIGLPRADVRTALPLFAEGHSGFSFTGRVSQHLSGRHELAVAVSVGGAIVTTLHGLYDFGPDSARESSG